MSKMIPSILLCLFLTFAMNSRPIYTEESLGNIPIYKDFVYNPKLNLSARIYLPQSTLPNQKLPLVVYIHGGAFISESPFSHIYNNFHYIFVPEANIIAVSIEYRLASATTCYLPCQYDDSWDALKWVASHLHHNGPDAWLNQHADFEHVFISGDSAGANIVHQMALRLGVRRHEVVKGFKIEGIILCHPYFWGENPIPGETSKESDRAKLRELWSEACPHCSLDVPFINPAMDPNLSRVASPRVQVFVSEKDSLFLRERGWYYAQQLRLRGWSGYQQVVDFQGEDHVFHLIYPFSTNSTILRRKMAAFINQKWNTSIAIQNEHGVLDTVLSM